MRCMWKESQDQFDRNHYLRIHQFSKWAFLARHTVAGRSETKTSSASYPFAGAFALLNLRVLLEVPLKSESTPYNRWHHRVAVFIAFLTFIVIAAGALVTSEDAGLSVPDWPTSYGHILRLPPWVGGIVYEHSHRMIASVTGILTIVIAFWTLFADRRRWMKILGFGA